MTSGYHIEHFFNLCDFAVYPKNIRYEMYRYTEKKVKFNGTIEHKCCPIFTIIAIIDFVKITHLQHAWSFF